MMGRLVSIDPGYSKRNALGWGAFDRESRKLIAAGITRPLGTIQETAAKFYDEIRHRLGPLTPLNDEAVIEVPRTFGKFSQVDADDLIKLSLLAGHASGILRVGVWHISPGEWKGQVPPDVMVKRIQSTLTSAERRLAEDAFRRDAPRATSIWHNGWDAIGIGLHKLERLKGR